jgi:ferredoxin-NADP reductase
MSNRQPDANSPRKRARQWRPNPHSLAAVSAANGDPTALLVLDAYELHDRPGQQPDVPDRRHHETPDSTRSRPVVGRLLSVNVGLPRNVAWAGKTIRTSIWKEPVDGPRIVRISHKREGACSRYLHDHLKVGNVIEVPRGSFVLRAGTRPVVLISAGVGATPVLAMLHALAGEGSTRPIWWLHGARNRDEHAFGAEVDALLSALPDGHRLVAYSRPAGDDSPGADNDVVGRLDLPMLERAGVPKDADYYLCGPDGFMRAIGAAITARGVAPERVATEAFGAVPAYASGIVKAGDRTPHGPDGSPGTGPTITFSRNNLAVAWKDEYPSLLHLAEACDVPVGFGCRHGVCHNCESGLLAGEVTYDTEPLEPPPDAQVLVCRSRPSSELTLDL